MRKTFCLMLLVLMCCMLTIPVMAASKEPVITLQPQSPNYPEHSVAIYDQALSRRCHRQLGLFL